MDKQLSSHFLIKTYHSELHNYHVKLLVEHPNVTRWGGWQSRSEC